MKDSPWDLTLLIIGLFFPILGIFGYLDLEKSLKIFVAYSFTVGSSFLAKKVVSRMTSAIAYFIFFVTFIMAIDESGILYGNYTVYTGFGWYLFFGGIGGFIAMLFRLRGHLISVFLYSYWIALIIHYYLDIGLLQFAQFKDFVAANYAQVGMIDSLFYESVESTYFSIFIKVFIGLGILFYTFYYSKKMSEFFPSNFHIYR